MDFFDSLKGQVPDLSLFLCVEAFVKDVKLW